jgi:hypothetical protein
MVKKLKEWQGYVGFAITIGALVGSVYSYKGKIDANAKADVQLREEVAELKEELKDRLKEIDSEVEYNTKFITNVHGVVSEMKGQLRAME